MTAPSGEPPVIGRIAARGAQYTRVKMLLIYNPMEIMWWNMFGPKTYRAIDKEIREREERTSDHERERDLTMGLRWHYVLNLCRDLNALPSRRGPSRWLEWWSSQDGTRLVVHERGGKKTRIVAERRIEAEWKVPPLRGDSLSIPGFGPTDSHQAAAGNETPEVRWINAEAVITAALELIWEFLPVRQVLFLRPGRLMRTGRAPKGWPLTTRAIERLYDYLLPFYQARAYRRLRRKTKGAYPAQLLRDITEILHVELVTAKGLKEADVRGAVQRYLGRLKARHQLKRPLGEDMF